MENIQQNIEEFVEKQKFSEEVFREIAQTLLTKYKNENARQHLVRALIMIFEKRYPKEMEEHEKVMQMKRELQVSKEFASNDQGQRNVFNFPKELWMRLAMFVKEPEFLGTPEEMEWVAKEFPEYLIPEKF